MTFSSHPQKKASVDFYGEIAKITFSGDRRNRLITKTYNKSHFFCNMSGDGEIENGETGVFIIKYLKSQNFNLY